MGFYRIKRKDYKNSDYESDIVKLLLERKETCYQIIMTTKV